MKRDLTFQEFSDKLDGMNERCGSCKYLKYEGKESTCTKHKIPRSNKDPICDSWRYFA